MVGFLICLLGLIFLLPLNAQATTQYKDIIISRNVIWALTDNGNLKLFDATNGNPIDMNISADEDIILITKDKAGNPVIANKRKQVKKYNESSNNWETIAQYDVKPVGILIDSKSNCYAITEKGIQDLETKKVYFNENSLNHQITYHDGWGKPYCFFIDRNDVIWLGFGYGEWGGNLYAFQTNGHKFLELSLHDFEIAGYPIKSFFEDSFSLYISAGLQHMFTSGTIVRIDSLKSTVLFRSESDWGAPSGKDSVQKMVDGEYIGPAAFNSFNNSIYFYSQHGIFKGDKTKDLSKIENWEKVVTPKLTWRSGQPDAVGSPMNVLKLCIIDATRFVFLSQNDGIGFFDGKKIIML
jgi:hypothetical protein